MTETKRLERRLDEVTDRLDFLERELSRKTQNLHDRIDGRGTRSYGNRPMPNCYEGRTSDGTESGF